MMHDSVVQNASRKRLRIPAALAVGAARDAQAATHSYAQLTLGEWAGTFVE